MSSVRTTLSAALAVLAACGGDDGGGAVQGWTLGFGSAGTDAPNALDIAPNGDVIVGGFFSNTVSVGDVELASANAWDGFVLATNAAGTPRWATRIGAQGNDLIGGVAVLDDGSVAVVGTFGEKLDLGGESVTSLGGTDSFVAVLDSDGQLLWFDTFGGSGDDLGRGVAPAGDGGVFITGEFSLAAGFDADLRVQSEGETDVFFAKLDAGGTPQWVSSGGGRGFDTVAAIAATADGGYAVAGTFEGNVHFGTDELVSKGGSDGFVAVYDAAGGPVWSRGIGDVSNDRVNGVSGGADGTIAIAGDFEGSINLGGGEVTSELTDAFVAVYDATGAHRWSSIFAGAGFAQGGGVSIDLDGGVSYAGGFFGDLTACGTSYTAFGENDVVAARFDVAGACKWAQRFGGAEDDFATAIATDVTGSPVIAGRFSGAGNFAYAMLESAGGFDVFLLTLPQQDE